MSMRYADMKFADMLVAYDISMTELSSRYGIPYRTLQGWKDDSRKPPEYVLELIEFRLKHETNND